MGLFTSPGRMKIWNKSRFIFLLAAVFAFALTEVGRYIYRPFIYREGINDFGLADSMGNLGGILVQIFAGAAIFNPDEKQSYRLAIFFSAGYVIYEYAQPYLPKGIFDIKDVYGTGIGFVLAVVILKVIWHFHTDSKHSLI